MVVTILWRPAGSPETADSTAFTDVSSGAWYAGAVAWASANGIVNGYAGRFAPNSPVTREHLAAMLYHYAQSPGKGFEGDWMMKLDYPDAQNISEWAYEALCWMTMHGIINGKGDGILDPGCQASRTKAAAMLMRFCKGILQ